MPKGWEWSDGNPIFLAKEYKKMIDKGEVKNQAGLDRLVLLILSITLLVGNTRQVKKLFNEWKGIYLKF